MWGRALLLLVVILLLWAPVARHKLVGDRVGIRLPRHHPLGGCAPGASPHVTADAMRQMFRHSLSTSCRTRARLHVRWGT